MDNGRKPLHPELETKIRAMFSGPPAPPTLTPPVPPELPENSLVARANNKLDEVLGRVLTHFPRPPFPN